VSTRVKQNRLQFAAFAVVVTVMMTSSACRLVSREVACRRDRDCPLDAGMSYCTSWDADAGLCTDDEDFRGDFPEEDAGDLPDIDAGAGDAGAGGLLADE
jgi:hypothetical protein